MHLLVSVASADEAAEAIAGGADIIDAKEPSAGPLGAVSPSVLREIDDVVAGRRVVTAALGDAEQEAIVQERARTFAAAGAAFVKVGFAAVHDRGRVGALLAAAVRGLNVRGVPRQPDGAAGLRRQPDRPGVIAVAYADDVGPDRDSVLEAAAASGAAGVLLDTARKDGAGLRDLVTVEELAAWVTRARRCGLLVAVAGKLRGEDLVWVRHAGADIAGVRGAACEGGRTGRVAAARVKVLAALLRGAAAAAGEDPAAVGHGDGGHADVHRRRDLGADAAHGDDVALLERVAPPALAE